MALSGFGIRVMVASERVWELSFLCSFLEEFERDFSSSLNVWYNSCVKSSGPVLLFVGRF